MNAEQSDHSGIMNHCILSRKRNAGRLHTTVNKELSMLVETGDSILNGDDGVFIYNRALDRVTEVKKGSNTFYTLFRHMSDKCR